MHPLRPLRRAGSAHARAALALAAALAIAAGGCKRETAPREQEAPANAAPSPPTEGAAPGGVDAGSDDPRDEGMVPADGPPTAGVTLPAELEAALSKPGARVDVELMTRALDLLAACDLSAAGVAATCPELRPYREALRRFDAEAEHGPQAAATLVERRLGASAPAVRWATAQLASGAVVSEPEVEAALVRAAAEEQNPHVLHALIEALGVRAPDNPEVGARLLEASRHEAAHVRLSAATWLASSFGVSVAGGLDRLVELLKSDPDPEVRAGICRAAYRRGDDVLVPLIARFVSQPRTDDALYRACWEGLVRFWVGYPQPTKPSQAAYALTLEHLSATPRSERRPGAEALRQLRAVQDDAWRSRAPFYEAAALAEALVAIAVDPAAGWMARAGAVDALHAAGASDALWERVQRGTRGDSFEDKQVRRALERLRR